VIFFVLTVLTIPFLPSGGTVPRWAFLSLVCAVLLFRITIHPFLVLFTVFALVMAYVGPVGYEATFVFWHFLLLAVLFCWAQGADLKRITIGAALAMAVNSVVVLIQAFTGWEGIPQLIPNSGLFYNHNMGAEAAAMILVLTVAYRLWWLIPGLLPTLYFGSRAPVLALGVAAGCALWRWSRFASLMATLTMLLLVVSMKGEGGHRYIFVSDDLIQRTGVWLDMLPRLTIWGHGLGSFLVEYPEFQRHTQALALRFENAHNDFLQVTYEMGLGGLILIAVFLARMTAAPRSPAWYALIVFMVEACFGFPLYEPVSGALAACCAGVVFVGCADLRSLKPAWRPRIWARVEDYGITAFPVGSPAFPASALASFWPRLWLRHARRPGRYPSGEVGFAI
jgi:hypothetical protein